MTPTEPTIDPAASAVGEVAFLVESGKVAEAVALAEWLVAGHPNSPIARAALSDATGALERSRSAPAAVSGSRRGQDLDPMDLESLDEEVASLHEGDRVRAESLPIEEIEQSLDFENFSIPRAPGIPPSAAGPAPEILHAASARAAQPPGPEPAAAGRAGASGLAALLETAEGDLAAGRCDEAISSASRAQVIEPDNARAQEIIDRAREQRDRGAREIEDMLYEAQRCLERKEWTGAENFLAEVLARRPDHEEAHDLLRDVKKLLVSEGDLASTVLPKAASGQGEASIPPPVPVAESAAGGLASVPLASRPSPSTEAPGGSSGSEGESGSDRGRGSRRERGSSSGKSAKKSRGRIPLALKVIVGIVVVLGALGGGLYMLRQSRQAKKIAASAANPPASKKGASKAKDNAADGSAQAAAKDASNPSAPAEAKPPIDPKIVFSDGKKALAAGRLEEAVASLETAVNADPSNGEAVDLLKEARELLARQQQSLHDLDEARRAFGEKRYDDSLRLLYRLPEAMQKGDVVRFQRNAWFNLSINDLIAGDCARAIEHFDEALGLDPTDAGAAKEKKFAETYRDRDKDTVFRRYAESITPRGFEDR